MGTPTQTSFAARVRQELARQKLTIRGLARKIDPQNVERARRNIHRWLDDGIVPHDASRREVALALGLEEDALTGTDDDEEDDPVVALVNAIRRLVRDEVRTEKEVPSAIR